MSCESIVSRRKPPVAWAESECKSLTNVGERGTIGLYTCIHEYVYSVYNLVSKIVRSPMNPLKRKEYHIVNHMNRLFQQRPVFSSQSVSQQISEFLREAVVQGTIKPNQHLVEESIARELGVSRTPVREAIRRLEAEGLVEYVAQRGSVVRQVSVEEISQIYDVRILLEGHAAKLAATYAQPRDLLALEKICDTFDTGIEDSDGISEKSRKLMDINGEYHTKVVELAANAILEKTLKALQVPGIYRTYYWHEEQNWRNTSYFHRSIFEAIRKKDSGTAERLMQEHLAKAQALIVESLNRVNVLPNSQD